MHKTSNKLILGAAIFLVAATILTVVVFRMITTSQFARWQAEESSRTSFIMHGSLKNENVDWLEDEDIL